VFATNGTYPWSFVTIVTLIFDYKCFIFDIWNELPLIFDYKCFIFDIWNAIVVILFITSILLFHLHYFKMIL
jgi:hypothetical protein